MRTPSLVTLAALAAVLAFPAPAAAQRGPEPPTNPFLAYSRPQDWTARVRVDIISLRQDREDGGIVVPQPFELGTVSLLFPFAPDASNTVYGERPASGELRVDGRRITGDFEVIGGYHSNAEYAKFSAINLRGFLVTLDYRQEVVAWRTEIDEARANAATWPTGDAEWPEEAESTFGPQFGIDNIGDVPLDTADIDALLKDWTQGRDPRTVPPYQLAKYFAGRVQEHLQVTGDGVVRVSQAQTAAVLNARLAGFDNLTVAAIPTFRGIVLHGANTVAQTGRGSPHDAAFLLAALYRRAGLPARTVLGYVEPEGGVEDLDDNADEIRTIVEFYLLDPNPTPGGPPGGWIPVDINELRRTSSRARPLDRPWRYFGTHPDLERFVPLAFHAFPPTTVRAYDAPALWGWFVTPRAPDLATQFVDFSVTRTARRGGRP